MVGNEARVLGELVYPLCEGMRIPEPSGAVWLKSKVVFKEKDRQQETSKVE